MVRTLLPASRAARSGESIAVCLAHSGHQAITALSLADARKTSRASSSISGVFLVRFRFKTRSPQRSPRPQTGNVTTEPRAGPRLLLAAVTFSPAKDDASGNPHIVLPVV